MRLSGGILRAALFFLLAGAAAGCGADDSGVARDTTAVTDTGAIGGLTPAEIRARAEPMSPEKAESLGIVDTTIHVESRDTTDTIPILQRPSNP